MDRSNPTETLQEDAFLVHVVRKFAHLIGMRAGRGFDVMWLVDQRESPPNRLVIARQADKRFQEANNAPPMLWAIFAQAGATETPANFMVISIWRMRRKRCGKISTGRYVADLARGYFVCLSRR